MATHTKDTTPLDVDPSSLPLSLASCSIGLPRHTLHQKIEAISQAGFKGIELSFPDLISYANQLVKLGQIKKSPSPSPPPPPPPAPSSSSEQKASSSNDDSQGGVAEDDWPALREAARSAAHLCATHGLEMLVLQPFANLEGWPRGSREREAVFARARGWLGIMEAAGCGMLQVGSTDSPAASGDKDKLAADLGELADLLRPKGFRVAYENWCWATHAPGWRDVWEIVRLAGRDNIGLCLDTFQSAGGEWGDPTTGSGMLEGDGEEEAVQASWRASLRELAATVPADRIYLLQVSDAYRMQPPLAPRPGPQADDDTGLRPRGRWSHDHRPLPYDGGYLPIADFTRAVLGTGFRGWLSVEVFDGRFEEKHGDDLRGYAEKARAATLRHVGEAAGLRRLVRSQENGVNGHVDGEYVGRASGEPTAEANGHRGRTMRPYEGRGQPSSMQAQRLQRIRGNYQDETRELPSGQDWPRSHSAVKEREEVVGARASIPKETSGGS